MSSNNIQEEQDENNNNIFHHLVKLNNNTLLKEILDLPFSKISTMINSTNNMNLTPLDTAIQLDRQEIIETLISYPKVEIKSRNLSKLSHNDNLIDVIVDKRPTNVDILDYALNKKDVQLLDKILSRIEINTINHSQAIKIIQNVELMKGVIRHLQYNISYWINMSIHYGSYDSFKYLLDIDINCYCFDHMPILGKCLCVKRIDYAKLALEKGANINYINYEGKTLFESIMLFHVANRFDLNMDLSFVKDVISFFLEYGVKIENSMNYIHYSLVDFAKKEIQYYKLLRELKDGFSINFDFKRDDYIKITSNIKLLLLIRNEFKLPYLPNEIICKIVMESCYPWL